MTCERSQCPPPNKSNINDKRPGRQILQLIITSLQAEAKGGRKALAGPAGNGGPGKRPAVASESKGVLYTQCTVTLRLAGE
jgi:hypothetical protein